MRTAIAGATGFIGSAMVRGLTENAHAVIALPRNPGRSESRRIARLVLPAPSFALNLIL